MDTFTASGTREKQIFRITRGIWYFVTILDIFLILRFALKLLQANSGASFTQMIYQITGIFVEPFRYVFPTPVVDGSVFEWSTLLALFVYWLIALAIVKLISMGRPVTHEEAKEKLDQDEVTL
jgi:uncharacterized protein YggT (Ycf19 family)